MLIPIRIGTRDSQLALWQAKYVQTELTRSGYPSELVLVKSEGDLDLQSPLYAMGVQGIFTKTLDLALLRGSIDMAVHSLKDVPTQTAEGIRIAAVPLRGNPYDVLVYKNRLPAPDESGTIATSSLRRAAQWVHRHPQHTTTSLRGNINLRLQKLLDHDDWDGAIFAAAGMERIGLEVPNQLLLDWMIPAPAQGALGIAIRTGDAALAAICATLDHAPSALATRVERDFLRRLMGGCTMPIGALATLVGDVVHLRGCVGSVDGRELIQVEETALVGQADELAERAARILLEKGGEGLLSAAARR
jgi:hydroxymethylbilane synthase